MKRLAVNFAMAALLGSLAIPSFAQDEKVKEKEVKEKEAKKILSDCLESAFELGPVISKQIKKEL